MSDTERRLAEAARVLAEAGVLQDDVTAALNTLSDRFAGLQQDLRELGDSVCCVNLLLAARDVGEVGVTTSDTFSNLAVAVARSGQAPAVLSEIQKAQEISGDRSWAEARFALEAAERAVRRES